MTSMSNPNAYNIDGLSCQPLVKLELGRWYILRNEVCTVPYLCINCVSCLKC
jgi:hypothetical protein